VRLVVTSQHRYYRTPAGAVWTDGKYGYTFWTRYLDVFETVTVVARVGTRDAVPPDWKRVDGRGVSLHPLPLVRGPWQYLRRARALRAAACAALQPGHAVILRVPGEIACLVDTALWARHRTYGVECVGDPYELYAPGGVRSVLRPLLRAWYPQRMRRECARAAAAAYVTERTLQRRYPPAPGAFTTHYSSIELDDAAFASAPRTYARFDRPIQLVTVGTLAQLYKAPDVLIDAVAACVRGGLDLRLRIVGDGRHRAELEQRAAQAGLDTRVAFVGQLATPAAVRTELDRADLFVLPSRQEGLPRATIEAMARGLACIGSTAGGTPELLPPEELVAPGDVAGLASLIRRFASDPDWLTRAAARNLAKAREYHQDHLRARRIEMYRALKDATASVAR
jgi:glycosyltransferase involved in cell wall biosynthesis